MSRGVLMQAVRTRSPVSYRLGDEAADRVMAPHIIFEAKNGQLSVAGRQIRNQRASKEVGEWLELPVTRLKSVTQVDGTFRIEASFQPFNPAYIGRIVCHALQDG